MKKSLWDKILKIVIAVASAVLGAYQREDGVYVAPINLLKP